MFRAVQLDSTLPWFVQVKPAGDQKDDRSAAGLPRRRLVARAGALTPGRRKGARA